MRKTAFVYLLMVIFMCGCSSAVKEYRNAALEDKIHQCMGKIQFKDWDGLYEDGNMALVQEDSKEEFLKWALIQDYWSTAEFIIDGYEILEIGTPTLSLRKGIPQAIVQVKAYGGFAGRTDSTGIVMTFMEKDGKWCLYVFTEVPGLGEPIL